MCVGEAGAREWLVISVSLVASSTPRRRAVEAKKAVRDRKDEPGAVEVENIAAQRTDSLTVELVNGGGFIARLLTNWPQISGA